MGGVVIFMVTLTIIQVRVLTIGQLMSTQRHCGKMDSTTHAHAQGLANARRREQNHCHRHGQNQHLLHFRILSDLMESVNWVSFGMGLSYTHSSFKSTKLQLCLSLLYKQRRPPGLYRRSQINGLTGPLYQKINYNLKEYVPQTQTPAS